MSGCVTEECCYPTVLNCIIVWPMLSLNSFDTLKNVEAVQKASEFFKFFFASIFKRSVSLYFN